MMKILKIVMLKVITKATLIKNHILKLLE